jgi:hypothetical protein
MYDKDGKKKYLCNSMEGQQFAPACRCKGWHVRFVTMHDIQDENDMFCQWCECHLDSWKGSNKDEVSAAEKEAMEQLRKAKLDHTTACQVKLPFWLGRMDFYHIPSRTAMQADGSSHFKHMYHRALHFQLMSDLKCCSEAWSQKYRLLRVHHEYANCKEAMIVATQLPHDRFVMLAGSYDRVLVWFNGQHISYIELLNSMIKPATYLEMAIPGCVIFY